MSEHVELGALLVRDGCLLLVHAGGNGRWVLPGGPLPAGEIDIDAVMDRMLEGIGVCAPAVEEDFLQTLYFERDGLNVLCNVYGPTEWTGEPAFPGGGAHDWVPIAGLPMLDMEPGLRSGVLQLLGLRPIEEPAAGLVAGLHAQQALAFPTAGEAPRARPGRGREGGIDVLRTLTGGDGLTAESRLQANYPELGDDVVSVIGDFWTGEALDRRTRSLQVVAMLAAMGGRAGPLRGHINGALNHGATAAQVVETLRMVAVYAGFPAALEAWPLMEEVFAARGLPRPLRAT